MQKNCFSYPVEFVEDVFGESAVLADVLKKVTGSETPKVLLVADMNVVQRTEGLGSRIGRYVQAHGIRLAGSPVVMAAGEKIKADSLQSVLGVVSALLEAKLGHNDVVLAIGGGTLLDVAGYAAAQVRGGVKIVRLPTTPAAMMDAAFADYAAVDSASVKDALRVPCVPAAVVIDTAFASTVLDGVWRSGMGEAVRLAVGTDSALVKTLVKLAPDYAGRDLGALAEIVRAVVAVRGKKGASKQALWVAARLEAMSGYKLPHGYAVSIGVSIVLGYAVEKKLLKAADRETVLALLKSCGSLDGLNHSGHLLGQTDNLLLGWDAWALSADCGGFVCPAGLGKSEVEESPDREVLTAVVKNLVNAPTTA